MPDLALLPTFVLALLILHDTWRKRLVSAGILIASVLPWMIGWGIRNEIVGGNATNRHLVWHPITAANFDTALFNVSTFLMPVEAWRRELFKFPGIFIAAIVIILGAVLIWILVEGEGLLRKAGRATGHDQEIDRIYDRAVCIWLPGVDLCFDVLLRRLHKIQAAYPCADLCFAPDPAGCAWECGYGKDGVKL